MIWSPGMGPLPKGKRITQADIDVMCGCPRRKKIKQTNAQQLCDDITKRIANYQKNIPGGVL